MTRNAALTVLLPGARIAPASSTCTWGHTRVENSGAKGLSRCSIVVGRVRIITSLWRTGDDRTLPLRPYEWIKSRWRDCLETPNRLHYGVLRVCRTGRMSIFSGAWRHQKTPDPTRTATFQTVSRS